MIKTVKSVNNQTITDLCLQVYGGLDNLVKFCTDNGVTDINFLCTAPMAFVYDTDYIQDQQNTVNVTVLNGVPYATGSLQVYITEDGSTYYTTEDGTPIIVE